MLTDAASTAQLVHRLQLHYLANPERHAQFALLTDWADADTAATDVRRRAAGRRAWQRIRALNARYPGGRAGDGRAALHRAAPRAALQRDRAALDRLGAQARQARAADRRAGGSASPPPSSTSAMPSRIAARHPLHRHARQRHPAAARAVCASWSAWPRIRRTSRGSTPAGTQGRRRLRHPAAAHRHAAARTAASFTLYHWLFAGQLRHRPVQRRDLRGLPGPVRRRQLSPARACSTCAPCTPCWPAGCPRARC